MEAELKFVYIFLFSTYVMFMLEIDYCLWFILSHVGISYLLLRLIVKRILNYRN